MLAEILYITYHVVHLAFWLLAITFGIVLIISDPVGGAYAGLALIVYLALFA